MNINKDFNDLVILQYRIPGRKKWIIWSEGTPRFVAQGIVRANTGKMYAGDRLEYRIVDDNWWNRIVAWWNK